MKTVYPIVIGILGLFLATRAAAIECPPQPGAASKDSQKAVKLAVGKMGPLKAIDFSAEVRKTTVDLMDKLPHADQIYLQQMLFSAFCTSIIDDKKLSDDDQRRAFFEYAVEITKAMNSEKVSNQQVTHTIEATYNVCTGEIESKCPRNTTFLPCGTDLGNWAKKVCSQYWMSQTISSAGGRCGYSVIEIKCK